MYDDWDARYGDGRVVVDRRARRLTVPPGVLTGVNYAQLAALVKSDAHVDVRRMLSVAHGCQRNNTCNPCVDTAILMTLEAEGWTIIREATSPPAGVGS